MAKLAALLALAFTALIAFNSSVSAFRTTRIFTTTIEDDDDVVFTRGSGREQHCRKEIQKEQVNDCKKYLEQNSPCGDVLEMSVMDPRRQQQKKELEKCCGELRNVKEECQCEAVQEAFLEAEKQHQQQQGEGGSSSSHHYGSRQILQKAQNLPSACDLKVQQCRIRSPWF